MSHQVAQIAKSKILVAGFAVFAMFFGSGNLVFPLILGSQSPSHWFFSSLGIAVTGVLVPFLGLVSMTCLQGSQTSFFKWLGKVGAFVVPFLMLLLIGPFGVIPRCIVVGYGAWQSFSSSTPLWVFTAICLLIIWIATSGKNKIVDVIGRYFTPFKLGALALVICGALIFAFSTSVHDTSFANDSSTAVSAFSSGFFEGYHTMDLIAALFFGVSIVNYFKNKDTKNAPFSPTVSAMAIGMALIFVVYMTLVFLGAAFSSSIATLPPTQMLPKIASISLGEKSNYLISFTLVISCLTTAVALTSVTIDFLTEKIPFLKNRRQLVLIFSLIVTFVIALADFTGIMAIMAPILTFLYPLTIALTLINICVYCYNKYKSKKIANSATEAA